MIKQKSNHKKIQFRMTLENNRHGEWNITATLPDRSRVKSHIERRKVGAYTLEEVINLFLQKLENKGLI